MTYPKEWYPSDGLRFSDPDWTVVDGGGYFVGDRLIFGPDADPIDY